MAYSTKENVMAEFKDMVFDANTVVTPEKVEEFIAEADATINSYVSKRYVLPIPSNSDGFVMLRMLSRSFAAERVRAIMEVKQATNVDGNQNPRRPIDMKRIIEMLEEIAEGTSVLIGATEITSGGFYSNNAANNVKPQFHKGRTEW